MAEIKSWAHYYLSLKSWKGIAIRSETRKLFTGWGNKGNREQNKGNDFPPNALSLAGLEKALPTKRKSPMQARKKLYRITYVSNAHPKARIPKNPLGKSEALGVPIRRPSRPSRGLAHGQGENPSENGGENTQEIRGFVYVGLQGIRLVRRIQVRGGGSSESSARIRGDADARWRQIEGLPLSIWKADDTGRGCCGNLGPDPGLWRGVQIWRIRRIRLAQRHFRIGLEPFLLSALTGNPYGKRDNRQ